MPHSIEPYLLNLAGEYRICSELCKRGIFATISYGHRKSADVYVISEKHRRAFRIEVKTTQRKNFVTSITQKHLATCEDAPDFWVLYQIKFADEGKTGERFFVVPHQDLCKIQQDVNDRYAVGYRDRHGLDPNFAKGVDNVRVENVTEFEDCWNLIEAVLHTDSSH